MMRRRMTPTAGVILLLAAATGACEPPTLPPVTVGEVYAYHLDTEPPSIIRWPSGTRIRVFLAGGSPQRSAVMASAFEHAAEQWNRAARLDEFELVRAPSLQEADVLIRWADDVSPVELDDCLPEVSRAVTTFCLDPDDHARLAVFPNVDGSSGSVRMIVSVLGAEAAFPERTTQLITHELGHVLGIAQHSPNENDLMYRGDPSRSTLSPRDAATVRVLYHTQPHIVP